MSLVLAMVVSSPAGGMGDPRARCSGREDHSHTQLSPLANPHGFFYSLSEFTHYLLLVKALLMPKTLLLECFRGRGEGLSSQTPH